MAEDRVKNLLKPLYEETLKDDCPEVISDLISPKFQISLSPSTRMEALEWILRFYFQFMILQGKLSKIPRNDVIKGLAFYFHYDLIDKSVRREASKVLDISDIKLNMLNKELKTFGFIKPPKMSKSGIFELSSEMVSLQKYFRSCLERGKKLNLSMKMDV